MEVIFAIGIDQGKGDVDQRSRFTLTKGQLGKLCLAVKEKTKIAGMISLMTCNRSEFYILGDDGGAAQFKVILAEQLELTEKESDLLFQYEGMKAIERIYGVAGGFQSAIPGEDEILRQVKNAMELAIETGVSCSVLNRLFTGAITCAKEIKSSTGLSEMKVSVASIGIDILEQKQSMEGKHVLLAGFGEMGQLAVQYLKEKRIGSLTVATRKEIELDSLNLGMESRWIPFERRYEVLEHVDFVISATGSPHVVFQREPFRRKYSANFPVEFSRRIHLLDMAVPRDVEKAIGDLPGVELFDMDHVKRISEMNLQERKLKLAARWDLVENHIRNFVEWYGQQGFHSLLAKVDAFVNEKVTVQAEAMIYKQELNELRLEKDQIMEYGKRLSERILKNLVLKAKHQKGQKAELYGNVLWDLLSD